eukprot:c21561_g1_i1 orf=230-877(+)
MSLIFIRSASFPHLRGLSHRLTSRSNGLVERPSMFGIGRSFETGLAGILVAGIHASCFSLQQSGASREPVEDDYIPEVGRRPSERVVRLANEMVGLSILEVSDVGDLLKKKLRISNSMMPMMGVPKSGAGGATAPGKTEEKKPEKLSFDVRLEKYDAATKIKIVKEVRTFTDLGLKEAKELVEKIPATLKTGLSKEEATEIVEKLKALGATAVMV